MTPQKGSGGDTGWQRVTFSLASFGHMAWLRHMWAFYAFVSGIHILDHRLQHISRHHTLRSPASAGKAESCRSWDRRNSAEASDCSTSIPLTKFWFAATFRNILIPVYGNTSWPSNQGLYLIACSKPAGHRWPWGSVLCTLGGSRREQQKRREEELEKKTEP